MIRRASFLLVSVAVMSGCATTYAPRPGPRLSVVMEEGGLAYVRDGQKFEHGMFGTGLIEAVEGVPEAEEHARTYRDRNVSGFATSLIGAGMIVGGAAMTADSFRSDRSTAHQGVSLGLLLGGVVVEVVASMIMASAPPHQHDAINIYNDAVEARGTSVSPEPSEGVEVVVE